MAGRPKKQTVDYFPHVVRHGKTMFIIEQKHGNDGYSFWFKLLELLGDTEGHYLDLNKPAPWEFLQSTSRLPPEKCTELLDLLAKLDAIDVSLWGHRIVWSSNFIDGIAPVYRKRGEEIPAKPPLPAQKSRVGGKSGDNNTQSRVEKSKGKKRKVEKRREEKALSPPPDGVDGSGNSHITVQQLAALFNEMRPPELSAVNMPFKRPARDMEKIRDGIKRNPERSWWVRVMQKVQATPFLCGQNDRGWKATLDFIATRSEVIIDGKYEKAPKRVQPGAQDWLERKKAERENPPLEDGCTPLDGYGPAPPDLFED